MIKTCPKCGLSKINIRWHAGDNNNESSCRDRIGLLVCNGGKEEHLSMTCQTCGYAWIGPIVGEKVAAANKQRLDE